ncbi:MAG: NADH-quinone oxidoreductase subunit H [Bacteroidales bacterium]|nr:NADH-quinone oxidoreductase subunit H [Bacteroidales bacterium]
MKIAGILLIFLAAAFFPGIILRIKSIASGRKGPGIFQPLKDLRVLFKKGSVFSQTTSIIFQVAPAISLASIMVSALLVPVASHSSVIAFEGDFVFFAYMLALGKFLMIISALDTGSGFEGMGANREALYSMLVEPAFFILIATYGMLTGFTSFSDIFAHFHLADNNYFLIFSIISVYVLVQIAMIENSRIPLDDPKTHLELTMIHEVIILDNSGFDKALIHIGSYLKFAIYGALIGSFLVPLDWNYGLQILLFIGIQVLFAGFIGLLESFRARNKMVKNAQYILTLSAIALVAFVVVLILTNKLIS